MRFTKVIIILLSLTCPSCFLQHRSKRSHISLDQVGYQWSSRLRLEEGKTDTLLWHNGKLCFIATGLANDYIRWQLYSQNVAADSLCMVTKNGLLNGLYSEYSENQHIVGYFTDNHRDGLFISRKKGEIVIYEFWKNKKLIQALNTNHLPEEDKLILTRWGDF